MSDATTSSPRFPYPLEGGCSCGQLRYRINAAPLVVQCCHCTFCQRKTGSAFNISVVIFSQHVELLPPVAPFVAGSQSNPTPTPAGPAPTPLPTKPDSSDGICAPAHFVLPNERQNGFTLTGCPACGTGLWITFGTGEEALNAPILTIRGGTLDRAWELPPMAHIYTRSKRDFIVLKSVEEGGVPQYEEFYPYTRVDDPEIPESLRPFVGLLVSYRKMLEDAAKAGQEEK